MEETTKTICAVSTRVATKRPGPHATVYRLVVVALAILGDSGCRAKSASLKFKWPGRQGRRASPRNATANVVGQRLECGRRPFQRRKGVGVKELPAEEQIAVRLS